MLVQQKQEDNKGSFFIAEGNAILGEMTYTMASPVKMIIEHTEVQEQLRGKNAGYQLVHAAVEYARAHHIKIIPLCPFANSVFKKKPEFGDVLFNN